MGRLPNDSGPRERRLTLADLMLLVAATTPGLAVARFADTLGLFDENIVRSTGRVRLALESVTIYGVPVLAAWTFLVLALALRGPRPPLRRLARRPGFVACACVALCLLIQAPGLAVRFSLVKTLPEVGTEYARGVGNLTLFSGAAILGAWLCLSLAGRLRIGRSWLDRFGFILGLFYIFLFFANEVYFTILQLL